MSRYSEAVARLAAAHSHKSGKEFDSSDLADKFIPAYNAGTTRVAVTNPATPNEVWIGHIGMSGGWRPCFLLMANYRSTGSSQTLSETDIIIAVKHPRQRNFIDPNTGKRVKFARSNETSYGAWVVAA